MLVFLAQRVKVVHRDVFLCHQLYGGVVIQLHPLVIVVDAVRLRAGVVCRHAGLQNRRGGREDDLRAVFSAQLDDAL